jgi:RecQ family ATP-dependent DNA helicase
MLWTEKAVKYLKKYWNITSLKDKQFQVINELLLGNDVIGLLPTGYGKSLCYLLPPLLKKKTMIIISPLISLMEDQKDKLTKMGIRCSALHCNNTNKSDEIYNIKEGVIKIIYMSPEYLIKGYGLELATELNESGRLGFLAIDESHCISSWGHDFRPEYTQVKNFRNDFPNIPIIAVTATATDNVCKDIKDSLKLNNPMIIRASFDRPNLYIGIRMMPMIIVKSKEKSMPKEEIVMQYVLKYPNEKIIIYINSRKDTEKLANDINNIKNISMAYHAGLNKKTRDKIHNDFISGDTNIIISTIAFGMGIDQTVRCVLIFGCPSSIEEYYQQIGRAGRDDKPAETVLYFEKKTFVVKKKMISGPQSKLKIDNLYKVYNMGTNISHVCKRRSILEYFNEETNIFNCNNCDYCCRKDLTNIKDLILPIIKNNTTMKAINIINDSIIHPNKDFTILLFKWAKSDLKDILYPTVYLRAKKELSSDDMIEKYSKMIKI